MLLGYIDPTSEFRFSYIQLLATIFNRAAYIDVFYFKSHVKC